MWSWCNGIVPVLEPLAQELDIFTRRTPNLREHLHEHCKVPPPFLIDVFELMYRCSQRALEVDLSSEMLKLDFSFEHPYKLKYVIDKKRCEPLYLSCFERLFQRRSSFNIARNLYIILTCKIATGLINTVFFWNVKILLCADIDDRKKAVINYVFSSEEKKHADKFIVKLYRLYIHYDQLAHVDAAWNFDYDEYLEKPEDYESFTIYTEREHESVYPKVYDFPSYDFIGVIASTQRIIRLIEIGVVVDAVPWRVVNESEIIRVK